MSSKIIYMLSNQTYQKTENQFTEWLKEFMKTEVAAGFSDFQKENIGKMLNSLLAIGKTIDRNPRTWTVENVLDLTDNLCKTIPEDDLFFENFPLALAPFFNFIGEQKYVRHGQAIGDALLKAKDDISQSPEKREELEYSLSLLRMAMDSGVDMSDPMAIMDFMQKKHQEEAELTDFFEKVEERGIDLNSDASNEDMMSLLQDEAFAIELDENKIAQTIAFLKIKLAKNNNLENALEDLPPALMPTLFGLIQSGRLEKELLKNNMSTKGSRYANTTTSRRKVSKKIGRNTPCTCGSGKKYKHCCGKRR